MFEKGKEKKKKKGHYGDLNAEPPGRWLSASSLYHEVSHAFKGNS